MTTQQQAEKIAADVLRQYPTHWKGRRTWARQQCIDMALEELCGEGEEFGGPESPFDEADEAADERASLAHDACCEWIGESWANRY